ncbi:MAG TPA: VOC family protein [Dehalococcoidia bacterium]|nr:VOC family protein [Dehalococcoidia bacterium]
MKETIGITRLDHVCWAVRSLDDALPLLTQLMGMTVEGRFENPQAGYRGVGLRVPGGTGHFELLEPLREDSFLHRFLAERGPGLHHVTFEVEDIERAARAIRDHGIEPFGGVQRSHGWAETYIHPKDSGGVLFQFYLEEDHHHHEDDHSHSHEYEAPK